MPTEVFPDKWEAHRKVVVIDAEKAFVHLLDPKYNVEKFASYPRSTDGLYGYGYQRYGFVLAENLTFLRARAGRQRSVGPSLGPLDEFDGEDEGHRQGDLTEALGGGSVGVAS